MNTDATSPYRTAFAIEIAWSADSGPDQRGHRREHLLGRQRAGRAVQLDQRRRQVVPGRVSAVPPVSTRPPEPATARERRARDPSSITGPTSVFPSAGIDHLQCLDGGGQRSRNCG